jgi:hypothetical protein
MNLEKLDLVSPGQLAVLLISCNELHPVMDSRPFTDCMLKIAGLNYGLLQNLGTHLPIMKFACSVVLSTKKNPHMREWSEKFPT